MKHPVVTHCDVCGGREMDIDYSNGITRVFYCDNEECDREDEVAELMIAAET